MFVVYLVLVVLVVVLGGKRCLLCAILFEGLYTYYISGE